VGRVSHLTRILRSLHLVELGNLLNSRIRVEQVNSMKLKLDPTIILIKLYLFLIAKFVNLSNLIIKFIVTLFYNNLNNF